MSRTYLNPNWASVNLLKGQNMTNKEKLLQLTGINSHLSSTVNNRELSRDGAARESIQQNREPVEGPIGPAGRDVEIYFLYYFY